MTAPEFKLRLVERLKGEFLGGRRRADGSSRPILEDDDCELVANLCLSEIGKAGLALVKAN